MNSPTHRAGGVLLALAALLLAPPAVAQEADAPRTLTPDDYGQFENLLQPVLSPDGRWLAYGVRRVDEEEELRLVDLEADSARVLHWGRAPAFSPDGRYLAWSIGVSPDEREALEEAGEPVREPARVLDLETGMEREWEEIRAFSFDARGRHLALLGHPPDEPEGKGADLEVVDLETGRVTGFGNVDSFAWADVGSLLALALATGRDRGNGVQLYDAADGRLRALDTSGSAYRSLAWRKDAPDLAVLRSSGPQGADSTRHALVAWRGLDGPEAEELSLDDLPESIADTLAIVGHRAPGWSDDGRRISLGLRPLAQEEEGAPEGEAPGDDPPGEYPEAGEDDPGVVAGAEAPDEDEEDLELADLQLWHSSDVRIVPQQQAQEAANRRRTLLAVWSPDDGRVVQVGTSLLENAQVTDDWRFGIERVAEPYPWGAMFGRPYHDVWAVDLDSGQRTRILEEVRYSWASEEGRYVLTFDGQDYHAHDLHGGVTANLTGELAGEFANLEYDTPTDLLPPHGVGGWAEGDRVVLLYDRHDVWAVAPNGGGGERLTGGAGEEVTHRILRVGPDEGGLAEDRPIYLSLREEPTERRGFARLELGAAGAVPGAGDTSGPGAASGVGDAPRRTTADARVETLLLEDAWPRGLVRADSAEVYLYRSEARHRSPTLHLAGPALTDAREVARTNPFVDDFAWTRSELLHFESEAGERLKGVLLYPADHDSSREYPMIVYTYERLSQGKHQFQVPSERSYYNFTVWTQEGYFVLLPDIVYRAREPGVSALEAVRPAVGAVVDRGLVDPERVGLIGHSWGGYQATYLPTRTGIFAASVAGAPLTDFKSFMGQIHWNPGFPEVDHWETGQARMEVPYWEDPEAHLRNSPLHHVHEMDTPLLMAFGDQDGVVEWWQGTVFYNFARRAGKEMVLLVYEGEDHGIVREPNQVDYHRRILEWFGHYLKEEPAPGWITDGVPLEALDEEKRRIRR